jgi:hypothetical protein
VNFVRVLIVCFSSGFSVNSMLGGENQRSSINHVMGYSEKAQCTGKQAYLEPNRNSLQKPIGGRSVFAFSAAKSMLKTRSQPIWSLLAVHCRNYRGEGGHIRATESSELYMVPLNKGV